MTALLPCPFCGGEASIEESVSEQWTVWCADEDCYVRSETAVAWPTKAEAIAAWNRRAPGAGTISDVMHFPRCLSPAEVQALHDFRVLFAEVRAIVRREGAEAMREAAAGLMKQGDADYRPASNNPGSAGDYWKGKADAYRDAAAAIRALPLPEEPKP